MRSSAISLERGTRTFLVHLIRRSETPPITLLTDVRQQTSHDLGLGAFVLQKACLGMLFLRASLGVCMHMRGCHHRVYPHSHSRGMHRIFSFSYRCPIYSANDGRTRLKLPSCLARNSETRSSHPCSHRICICQWILSCDHRQGRI
jgi:hypothetical protein